MRMQCLAHRGYHAHCRENTLESFHAALALGVDGIETDVWMSSDHVPVLFHDRYAPGGVEVSTMTHAQLCAAAGFHVPTLDEALALSHDILWNIELKTPAAAHAVAEAVRQRRHHPFLLTSFYHPTIAELARETPVECGLLIAHRPLDVAVLFPQTRPTGLLVNIVCDAIYVDHLMVASARRLGLRTFAYGLHSADDHTRARHCGVDGVITDHPALVPAEKR